MSVRATLVACTLFACETQDLVVGEDRSGDGGVNAMACGSEQPVPKGHCLIAGSKCRAWEARACPVNTFCCIDPCPPAPEPLPACDRTDMVTVFDRYGCAVAYACEPVPCHEAGGSCIAGTTICNGAIGFAADYPCDGGAGCCLP